MLDMESKSGELRSGKEREALWSKPLSDLHDLVDALVKSLPANKPWQRQLHVHLAELDRQIQVLRLLISLGRDAETAAAVEDLRATLRAANAYVSVGRADVGTKMAVRLAFDLGKKLNEEPLRTPEK